MSLNEKVKTYFNTINLQAKSHLLERKSYSCNITSKFSTMVSSLIFSLHSGLQIDYSWHLYQIKLYEKNTLLFSLPPYTFDRFLFFLQILSGNIISCTQILIAAKICWVKSDIVTISNFPSIKKSKCECITVKT